MKSAREGYKMTELGEIPKDWSIKTINDLIKENIIIDVMDGNHGEIHPKASEYVDIGIPFIMANNLKNGKLDIEGCKFISYEQAKRLRKGFSVEGDVLLTHKGTLGETAIVPKLRDEYIMLTPQVTYYRVSNNNVLINRYLKVYFDSKKYQDKLKSFGSQSTRDYVGITEQRKLSIILPTIEEQEKIASIISTVDEQIDNVDALIEKNKELKKGLMQTLLTKGIGHTKFKKTEIGEIPEEWEVKELDLIGEIITGSTPKTSEKDNYGNEYLWVSPGDLGIKKYVTNTVKMLSDKGFSKTRKLPKGAILVTCIGSTIGKMGISKTELSTNQQINSIICNDKVNSEFIYYALNYNFNMYTSFISTQAVPIINKTTFGKFLIQVPNIREQIKIASVLSEVDEKLDEYENRKQKLEELKRGLMQQLLTGMIRVTV